MGRHEDNSKPPSKNALAVRKHRAKKVTILNVGEQAIKKNRQLEAVVKKMTKNFAKLEEEHEQMRSFLDSCFEHDCLPSKEVHAERVKYYKMYKQLMVANRTKGSLRRRTTYHRGVKRSTTQTSSSDVQLQHSASDESETEEDEDSEFEIENCEPRSAGDQSSTSQNGPVNSEKACDNLLAATSDQPGYTPSPGDQVALTEMMRKMNVSGAVPTKIKCTSCGWAYKIGSPQFVPFSSTSSNWKCGNCTDFWRVPTWGGMITTNGIEYSIVNTCSLDAFLAILISYYLRHLTLFQSFGSSDYEQCLDDLLATADIDAAKGKLIEQFYEDRLKDTIYDLKDSDWKNISQLAEQAGVIKLSTKCNNCSGIESVDKFEIAGVRKPAHFTWSEYLHGLVSSVHGSCGFMHEQQDGELRRCGGPRETIGVEAKGWMIPIDLSLLKIPASTVDEFPEQLLVGNRKFKLGGVSIYDHGKEHFIALISRHTLWILYDGMEEKYMQYVNPREMTKMNRKKEPAQTVSILYYFELTEAMESNTH